MVTKIIKVSFTLFCYQHYNDTHFTTAIYPVCVDTNRPTAVHPILVLGVVYANCSLGCCKLHGVPVTTYDNDTHKER